MTSAITNPLLPEVKSAVMAADVLMGNDPDAAAGSRPTGSRRPKARSAGAGSTAAPSWPAEDAGPPSARPPRPTRASRWSSSRRRAGAGGSRPGTTVLDAARSLGVDIDSVCGGRGICGRCQVTQGLGEFPKHGITSAPGHLSPFGALEATYRDEQGPRRRPPAVVHGDASRGDVLIDVPPESQVHRQVVRKDLDVRDFTVDPVVRLHYVEVDPARARLADRRPGAAFEALEREWGLTDLEADLDVIRALQPALEAGRYGVTVAVHDGHAVIAVWPGLHETALRRGHRRRLHDDRRPPRRTWPTARSSPATA